MITIVKGIDEINNSIRPVKGMSPTRKTPASNSPIVARDQMNPHCTRVVGIDRTADPIDIQKIYVGYAVVRNQTGT